MLLIATLTPIEIRSCVQGFSVKRRFDNEVELLTDKRKGRQPKMGQDRLKGRRPWSRNASEPLLFEF
jgi:hypothetical protein